MSFGVTASHLKGGPTCSEKAKSIFFGIEGKGRNYRHITEQMIRAVVTLCIKKRLPAFSKTEVRINFAECSTRFLPYSREIIQVSPMRVGEDSICRTSP